MEDKINEIANRLHAKFGILKEDIEQECILCILECENNGEDVVKALNRLLYNIDRKLSQERRMFVRLNDYDYAIDYEIVLNAIIDLKDDIKELACPRSKYHYYEALERCSDYFRR